MPYQDQSSHSTLVDQPGPQHTVSQLINLHDENIRLADSLKKVQSDYDLLNVLLAVNKPRSKILKRKYKDMMLLRLGITRTLLDTRLKRARKKFSGLRVELLKEHEQLHRSTVHANEIPIDNSPRSNLSTAAGGRANRNDLRRSGHGQQGTPQEAESNEGEDEIEDDLGPELDLGGGFDERGNILRPVGSRQLPDDDVAVEVDGRRLTQRQLAEWYQTTDMQSENRRIFEARNIEINQMRRIKHRK